MTVGCDTVAYIHEIFHINSQIKKMLCSRVMVFNLGTQRGTDLLSSRPHWSTDRALGQLELHREALF